MSKEWSWKRFWNSGLPYQGPDNNPKEQEMTEDGPNKSVPSVENGMQMASRTSTWGKQVPPGTHPSMWTGKPVPNDNSMSAGYSSVDARNILGTIGVVALIAGIIMLISSFNATSLASAHAALVTLVCGSLLTLIGSLAVISLLAVKANSKS